MALGKRIKERREELGMEQQALADAAKVSQPRLSALETRDSKSCKAVHAIAKALGVRSRWLATGEGPKLAEAATEALDVSQDALDIARTWDALPKHIRNHIQSLIFDYMADRVPALRRLYSNTSRTDQERFNAAIEIAQQLHREQSKFSQ